MVTEQEIKQEIENINNYISELEEYIKNNDEEFFEYNFNQIRRYRDFKTAFEIVLNGFTHETGSY